MDSSAQRWYNTPLLVDERLGAWLVANRGQAFHVKRPGAETPPANAIGAFSTVDSNGVRRKPYAMLGEIAVIRITGILLHRDYWIDEWASGYEAIRACFDLALADDDVKGIVFDCDSPGGEVSGCFDLSDHIYRSRGSKPIVAVVDERAHSAAYALASAADRIAMMGTAFVGSVGVVMVHIDQSGMLEQFGVKPTFIFAGKHKVDGNSYEPLPEPVRARFQERIDAIYDRFVVTVARNLNLSEDAVRKTEADIFSAEEALARGLAHRVITPDQVSSIFDAQSTQESMSMTTKTPATAAQSEQAAAAAAAAAQAAPDAAAAAAAAAAGAAPAASAEQLGDARAKASAEERARITAILGAKEAEGREQLAQHLAMQTSMPAAEAIAALGCAKKADKSDSDFHTAMNAGDQPGVGAGGEGGNGSGHASGLDYRAIYNRANGRA